MIKSKSPRRSVHGKYNLLENSNEIFFFQRQGSWTVDKICLDFMSVAANAAAVRKSPAVAAQLQRATLSWEDARKS